MADDGLVEAVLAQWANAPALFRTDDELTRRIVFTATLIDRLQAFLAQDAHELTGRGVAPFRNTNPVSMFRDLLRIAPGTARRLVEQGTMLAQSPPLQAAAETGAVTRDQVPVIAHAITALPMSVGDEDRRAAEAFLIAHAAVLAPHELQAVGHRLMYRIDPIAAAQAEDTKLARQEQAAQSKMELHIGKAIDGLHRVHGYLTTEAMGSFTAVLDVLAAPTRGDEPDGRTPGQRRADALVIMCDFILRGGHLGVIGGESAQLTVTVDYDITKQHLGKGLLDNGELITPQTVRRLACDARLLPVVLAGRSQPMDVGRMRRLIDAAIRRATIVRDNGCAFPGCDRPPTWTIGHHITHWADGGDTAVTNAVMLCPRHHVVIHKGEWEVFIGADGHAWFRPPLYIDPKQKPRRNWMHHPELIFHPPPDWQPLETNPLLRKAA